MNRFSLLLAGLVLLTSLTCVNAAPSIDFARDIRPILSNYCFHCHGPDDKERKGGKDGSGGLRLDTEEGAHADLGNGVGAVVAGKPEVSALLERILSKDADEVMPPPKTGKKPTDKEIALLREWIRSGAKYAAHWAYQAPKRPALPEVAGASHPVDRFLFARLAAEGLKPNGEADRSALARRVALDLTGLPPSLAEVEAFEKDGSPKAYERFVDSMLAAPAYGEHWARLWLDLARYADSAGYPSDPGRSIWAYRDWVIRAFNDNLRFDRFTVEQLAGDLLPNATESQVIATAFHRNTMTNNEGGTSDEEFRNAAVVDRVNTTWAVWMGTSMACSQCHNHKYDPFSQADYFRSFAIFNQTEDADRNDESPLHRFLLPEDQRKKDELAARVAGLEAKFAKPSPEWLKGFAAWHTGLPRVVNWQVSAPQRIASERAAKLAVSPEGRVRVESLDDSGMDLQTLIFAKAGSFSALRLATVPDAALPGKGASFAANGSFSVDAVRAFVVPEAGFGKMARTVRLELTGAARALRLEGVEVFVGDKNVLEGKVTSAVTKGAAAGEYAEFELGADVKVDRIRVRVPKDGGYLLGGSKLTLRDAAGKVVWTRVMSDVRSDAFTAEVHDGRAVKVRQVIASLTAGGWDAVTLAGLPSSIPNLRNRGWSAAPGAKPAEAVLIFEKPEVVKEGERVVVEVDSRTRNKGQMLASYEVALTGDAGVEPRLGAPAPLRALLEREAASLKPEEVKQLQDHYVRQWAPEADADRKSLAGLKKEFEAMKPDTVPVMKELGGDKRRVTKIQLRGNFMNLGDEVQAGTPPVLPPLPTGRGADRLAMAEWMVSRDNPLTARVTVNRLWEAVFGTGLVRTTEEFGAQGELPSHPELLDWLATEFVEQGWDVKGFLKMLLMSQAYRQSSAVRPDVLEKDPENRLVSRGPRFRVTGEQLRDQALSVSGLLSSKMFGKPVRPPKPSVGISLAFGGGTDWTTSAGEDRYRRAIYTEVRRSSPYPAFSTFDAPNREVCTIRRNRTNTPLQAFVTLNDPVFVEAAQGLARRVIREASGDAARIDHAFRVALSRHATEPEVRRVEALLQRAREGFRADAEAAKRLATDPIGALPQGLDAVEAAAWTGVANVVLNLDEFVMRR